MEDPTPPTNLNLVTNEGLNTQQVDCESCWDMMTNACASEGCPMEHATWYDCTTARGSDACQGEFTRMNDCLREVRTTYSACLNREVLSCFGESE